MLSVGHEELGKPLGKTVLCWKCGKRHHVQYGETVGADGVKVPSKTLAFFRCGSSAYLCGINGKEWRPRNV
jgi:hypothetical protein